MQGFALMPALLDGKTGTGKHDIKLKGENMKHMRRTRSNPAREYEKPIPTSYEVRYYIYSYAYPIRGGSEEVRLSESFEAGNDKLALPMPHQRDWSTIYFDSPREALSFVRKNLRRLSSNKIFNLYLSDELYLNQLERDQEEIISVSKDDKDYVNHVAYIGFDKIPLYDEE